MWVESDTAYFSGILLWSVDFVFVNLALLTWEVYFLAVSL